MNDRLDCPAPLASIASDLGIVSVVMTDATEGLLSVADFYGADGYLGADCNGDEAYYVAAASVYDYQTGDRIRTATAADVIAYIRAIEGLPESQREVGAVDGAAFGSAGAVYLV